MDSPFFSIIVPIYNVEKYLRECLDSILNQSFTNFELILVDDGSPDSCPAICDTYAVKDSRVTVIHQPNGGVSSARNAGLDAAKGEYVIFVDSDDYHLEESLDRIYHALLPDKPDALCFGIRKETDSGCIDLVSKYYEGSVTDELLLSLAYAGIVCSNLATIDVSPVNKAYKLSIIKEASLTFDVTMRIAEDISFNVPYFCRCKTILCLDSVLYFYRKTPNSAIHIDKGFAEKGMERSVYFLSRIQKALEPCISREKLYPTAKNRYNRLVIDACSNQQKRKCSAAEMFHFIRNCCHWHQKYLELYGVALPGVCVCSKKAKLEDLMIRNRWTLLIWLYTKAVHMYHSL